MSIYNQTPKVNYVQIWTVEGQAQTIEDVTWANFDEDNMTVRVKGETFFQVYAPGSWLKVHIEYDD